MSKFFIHRPVFAGVIAIIIVLAGLLSAKLLAVAQENVLGDPSLPNVGSNQVIHVMADAAYRVTGTRPVDPELGLRRAACALHG